MKKLFLFLFSLVLWQGCLFSQTNKLVFDFDYATFAYDSASCFVELYYSFGQTSLKPTETDSGYVLDALMKIEIQDTVSKKYIVNKEWRVVNTIKDSLELRSNKSLLGVIGFVIPGGIYKCSVRGKDAHKPESTAQYNEMLILKNNFTSKMSVSDIELASNIFQENASKNSLFYKNSLEVVPIPTAVFGASQPVIYYYTEMYNLKKDQVSAPLKIDVVVYNSKKKVISSKTKYVPRTNDSRVEVGTINASKYISDTYTLSITLSDSGSSSGISSAKRFFVYNPGIVDSSQVHISDKGVMSSEFGIMSVDECDDLFEKAKYISTPVERNQYQKIKTVEGKRDFLYEFWKKRDTEPETPKNEFYIEFLGRVQEATEKFSTLSKVGWKTDRGRVLITYGEPSEIERYPNQVDKKPYEIWQYNNLEGGVEFVFADLTGFSDYTLVHSTKRGELQDDTWERRVDSM